MVHACLLWFALSESYCISRRTIAAGTLYGWLLMMLEIKKREVRLTAEGRCSGTTYPRHVARVVCVCGC